jgi:hypothetical protein
MHHQVYTVVPGCQKSQTMFLQALEGGSRVST